MLVGIYKGIGIGIPIIKVEAAKRFLNKLRCHKKRFNKKKPMIMYKDKLLIL